MKKLRLAVLLSGSGTTLENLFERQTAGTLRAEVAVVVANRADAYGLERARRRNVPALVVDRRAHKGAKAFSEALFAALEPYQPDLVVLAGFLCLLWIPDAYCNRVINVHPSLLPSFGGKGFFGHHVHEAVLKHGCKVSGCTVHLVNNEYDSGPIVAQAAVPVLHDDTADTLAARVQAAEREIYPQVINEWADGRIRVQGERAVVNPVR